MINKIKYLILALFDFPFLVLFIFITVFYLKFSNKKKRKLKNINQFFNFYLNTKKKQFNSYYSKKKR